MRRAFWAILILVGYFIYSVAQNPAAKKTEEKSQAEKEAALVEYKADLMTVRGDDIVRFIGNVKFHHNGAIIECDSALKYDNNRMEFFGKVLISQDSTYIYGDRVYYDGRTSVADVYAPIIKLVRGDVTLYTYNLSFNTKTNVGTFSGGGVITQRDNMMESTRGEYNSKTNTAKFMDSVAMRSDSYEIRTDSLRYNLDAEQATFLARAYIWDHDRDFLSADRGDYFSKDSTYVFTKDAYIMTEDREMWADTIRYETRLKHAYMFSNAQVLDTVNSSLMFADWAFYDDSMGLAVLTELPSVRGWQKPDSVRYDTLGRPIEERMDTTYMRGDSILLFTVEPGKSKPGIQRMLTIRDSVMVSDTIQVVDSIKRDTTYTVRDTLQINERAVPDTIEKERIIRSFHNVKIWNREYQAVTDSLDSFSVDSTMSMYIKPILWSDNNQITSELIDLYTRNEQLDWADFTGNPFIAQQVEPKDTVNFNQASGKSLKVFFNDNDIDYALLSGNVLNIYYSLEKGRVETMASVECAELNITFTKREASRMNWRGAGKMVIDPIEKISSSRPQFLEGFTWQDSLRPKSATEIDTRIERPSIRAVATAYHKPSYAISVQMEVMKETLKANGSWTDRVDLPQITPAFFKEDNELLF